MHLGFEIKPNGFSRKTGGYLGSRDGGGGERLRRVAASGERRRGSDGRRVGRRGRRAARAAAARFSGRRRLGLRRGSGRGFKGRPG